jgi:hypothetical protein
MVHVAGPKGCESGFRRCANHLPPTSVSGFRHRAPGRRSAGRQEFLIRCLPAASLPALSRPAAAARHALRRLSTVTGRRPPGRRNLLLLPVPMHDAAPLPRSPPIARPATCLDPGRAGSRCRSAPETTGPLLRAASPQQIFPRHSSCFSQSLGVLLQRTRSIDHAVIGLDRYGGLLGTLFRQCRCDRLGEDWLVLGQAEGVADPDAAKKPQRPSVDESQQSAHFAIAYQELGGRFIIVTRNEYRRFS